MNTQNNTPASRNEEAVPTDAVLRKIFYSAHDAIGLDEWMKNARKALAAPGAAIDAREQEANLGIERLGAPTLENQLRFVHEQILPDYSPNYKGSTLWHRITAALASRQEAPAASGEPSDQWAPHQHSPGRWSVARPSTSGGILEYLDPGAPMLTKRDAKKKADAANAAPSEALSPATVAQTVTTELLAILRDIDQHTDQGRQSEKLRAEHRPGYGTGVYTHIGHQVQKMREMLLAQPCASQGCGGAAVRHALQQIVDADDAQALTQQLIEIGRAALSTAKSGGGATPEGGGE